jgi:D-alanine-D-alanine ligase
MKIVVLTGGLSSERNVALASGKAIAAGLRESGHDVKVVDPILGASHVPEQEIFESHPSIGKEFPTAAQLKSYSNRKVIECINSDLFDNIDVVFLGLHGKFGEDGKVQSLLEMRGVRYTGSDVISSALAMDKDIAKIIFRHYSIPTPDWSIVPKPADSAQVDRLVKSSFGYPIVIKPNDEGSTVGLSIVQPDVEDVQLKKAVDLAFDYSDKILLEEFVAGRELTAAVLGSEALPIVEIIPIDGFYDYEHKYTKGKTNYVCPAKIPSDLAASLQKTALKAHNALGCKAYSRVDFRLNSQGKYFCLEVNTLPGMTEFSLVPQAARAAGISFPQLLNKIIEFSV